MMKPLLILGALVLTAAASASAAIQAGGPRAATLDQMSATGSPAIRGWMVSMRGQCGGAAPRAARGAIQAADINGDGREDYLVNNAGVGCGGRATPGASGYLLFRSQGGDHRRDDIAARTVQLGLNTGRWLVLADGQVWSGDGYQADPYAGTAAEGPVSAGGGLPYRAASWTELSRLSSVGAARWRSDLAAHCSEAGGAFRFEGNDDELASVQAADLNGDGRDDYLVATGENVMCGASYHPWCGNRGGCRYDVLLSRGQDYVAARQIRSIGVEIAALGDRLVIQVPQDSGDDQFLGWDGREMSPTSGPSFRSQGEAPDERRTALARAVSRSSGSTAASATGAFREGRYGGQGDCSRSSMDDGGLGFSGREITFYEIDGTSVCRVVSSQTNGRQTRITYECRDSCGNGDVGYCPERYFPAETMTVTADQGDRITVATPHYTGSYAYCGSSR